MSLLCVVIFCTNRSEVVRLDLILPACKALYTFEGLGNNPMGEIGYLVDSIPVKRFIFQVYAK